MTKGAKSKALWNLKNVIWSKNSWGLGWTPPTPPFYLKSSFGNSIFFCQGVDNLGWASPSTRILRLQGGSNIYMIFAAPVTTMIIIIIIVLITIIIITWIRILRLQRGSDINLVYHYAHHHTSSHHVISQNISYIHSQTQKVHQADF